MFGTSNACIISTKLACRFKYTLLIFKMFLPSYSRASLMQKTRTLTTFKPGFCRQEGFSTSYTFFFVISFRRRHHLIWYRLAKRLFRKGLFSYLSYILFRDRLKKPTELGYHCESYLDPPLLLRNTHIHSCLKIWDFPYYFLSSIVKAPKMYAGQVVP